MRRVLLLLLAVSAVQAAPAAAASPDRCLKVRCKMTMQAGPTVTTRVTPEVFFKRDMLVVSVYVNGREARLVNGENGALTVTLDERVHVLLVTRLTKVAPMTVKAVSLTARRYRVTVVYDRVKPSRRA